MDSFEEDELQAAIAMSLAKDSDDQKSVEMPAPLEVPEPPDPSDPNLVMVQIRTANKTLKRGFLSNNTIGDLERYVSNNIGMRPTSSSNGGEKPFNLVCPHPKTIYTNSDLSLE